MNTLLRKPFGSHNNPRLEDGSGRAALQEGTRRSRRAVLHRPWAHGEPQRTDRRSRSHSRYGPRRAAGRDRYDPPPFAGIEPEAQAAIVGQDGMIAFDIAKQFADPAPATRK